MLTFPNGKINIGLAITEKRSDGFHNLQSCFYPVGWTDILEIIPSERNATRAEATQSERATFSSSGLPIPGDPSSNLCVRAYQLLQESFDLPPVQIHLHKIVPIGAGLGGGSADAAFALTLLNDQFGLALSLTQLEEYARRLGSDCAFFIQNKPRYCVEKGDVFEPIDLDLSGYYALLVYPNLAISTAEAYAGVRPCQPQTSLSEQLQQPMDQWRTTVHNDFEDSLFPKYPILGEIKGQLYEAGAIYASMSGSGSTVYGIFNAPPVVPGQFSAYSLWQGKL